jgi:hypothetical protein
MNKMLLSADNVVVASDNAPEFSWRAVFAGALVASAVIFFLLLLGSGVGLSLISVLEANAATAKSAITLGAIYFFAAQAFGLAVGGYLAGRLMGPVLESESEELFHSSTHGLVVWGLGVVMTATMIVLSGLVLSSSGLNAAALLGASGTNQQQNAGVATAVTGYWVDTLFRPAEATQTAAGAQPQPSAVVAPAQNGDAEARAETARVLAVGLAHGEMLSQPDHDRIVALVSRFTGVDMTQANRRVNEVLNRVRQAEVAAAEAARKAARMLSLWLAASLIFGALAAAGAAVSGRWADDEARAKPLAA